MDVKSNNRRVTIGARPSFVKQKKQEIQDESKKKPELASTEKERTAIAKLNDLTAELGRQDLKKEEFEDIVLQKSAIISEAGNSRQAETAIQVFRQVMTVTQDRFDAKQAKQAGKQEEYVKIIGRQRKTPLETLIWKNSKLPGEVKVSGSKEKKDKKEKKSKKKNSQNGQNGSQGKAPEKKGRRRYKWLQRLKSLYEKITEYSDLSAGTFGGADDIKDLVELDEVETDLKKENYEMDDSFLGIGAAVISGFSTVIKIGKHLSSVGHEIKKSINHRGEVLRDNQERRKLLRKFLHEVADCIQGGMDTLAPVAAKCPFVGPSCGILFDVINTTLNVADLISNSTHVHYMRKDKERVMQRIQAKKDKYTKESDTKAAEAYTLGEKEHAYTFESTVVDDKRRALMEAVGKEEQITAITHKQRRSKNDSTYRDLQYGLGKRIQGIQTTETQGAINQTPFDRKAAKSRKRQLEALELMEQYRELDKSHKKMAKMVTDNVGTILGNIYSCVKNSLKLAGQICVTTGVGAGAGVGLIAASAAMGATKTGADLLKKGGGIIVRIGRKIKGSDKNQDTTREDMAISLMDRMTEVSNAPAVWEQNSGTFQNDTVLREPNNHKEVVRQGRNVEHLHSVFRRGLNVTISDLIHSKSKHELKDRIANSFDPE